VRVLYQLGFDWIIEYVLPMPLIISFIANAMVLESSLPYIFLAGSFLRNPMGEAALDKLHGFFDGNHLTRCEKQMKVTGHDHKFMEQIFALLSIIQQSFYEQVCPLCRNERVVPDLT
jgi:hypothetical protein